MTYKLWPALQPRPDDAGRIRRLWNQFRKNRFAYEMRRKLAYDYWLAKRAGRERGKR